MGVKISVIMSVSDNERHLSESIGSILYQSYTDFEFIIVHDGTSEKIKNELLQYCDVRIKTIFNEKNIGLTKSLNKALDMACGEYIARLDAGDISSQHRLALQYNFLKNNPEFSLAGSQAMFINNRGEKTFQYKVETDESALREKLISHHNNIIHPTIMFRNEKDLRYREKFWFAQDYDLYLNLLSQNKRVINLADKLIKYRVKSSSISYEHRVKQLLFANKAREMYHERINTGVDSYNSFDPDDILNFDIQNCKDPELLKTEMEASLESYNLKKLRKIYVRYVTYSNKIDKFFLFCLVSFLPKPVINVLRKISFYLK